MLIWLKARPVPIETYASPPIHLQLAEDFAVTHPIYSIVDPTRLKAAESIK